MSAEVRPCASCSQWIEVQATECRHCGAPATRRELGTRERRELAAAAAAERRDDPAPVDARLGGSPSAQASGQQATARAEYDRQAAPRRLGVAVGLLAGLFAVEAIRLGLEVFPGASSIGRPRWEYRVDTFDDYSWNSGSVGANRLGDEGWEIVGSRRATSSSGGDAKYECILRRRK